MADDDLARPDLASSVSDAHGLIFGRLLDGNGGARPIDWDGACAWQAKPGETLWVHLDRTEPEIEDWLTNGLRISKPTVEVLISNDTRPRAFCENDTLVTILRGINFNPGAEPEDMIAIQIWADANRVITLRRRKLQTPLDVQATLDAGKGPQNSGDLLTELIEQLVAKMNRSIVSMNDRIDELEAMGDDVDSETLLDEIAAIRRQCLALKRYMSPQHEALQQISRSPPPWLSDTNIRDIQETIERLRRYLDDLDVSKESALVLQDDLNNRVANQSNKTMYMLSIVAAIFLPLGFITGLLGINVGGMPGVESPDAFWLTVGALIFLFAVQIAIFRKIKWL